MIKGRLFFNIIILIIIHLCVKYEYSSHMLYYIQGIGIRLFLSTWRYIMAQAVNTNASILAHLVLTDTDAEVTLVIRQGDGVSHFHHFQEGYERRWETIEFEEGNTVFMNLFDEIMIDQERLQRFADTKAYQAIETIFNDLIEWRVNSSENYLKNRLLRNVRNVNVGDDVYLNGWFNEVNEYGEYEIVYTFED